MSQAQPPSQAQYSPAPPPSKHRRSPYERSPSPRAASRDRSAVSTPPLQSTGGEQRRDPGPPPPPPPGHYAYDMSRGYSAGGYMYAPPPQAYHPPPPHDERYGAHPHAHHYAQGYPMQHAGYVPYPLPGTILSAPMAPPSQNGGAPNGAPGGVPVVFTDDAATKLSDRVRRRCFNCCTTDTSTWRRSNLSPGKVLCNKCGLFERTHSRARPEQFPHKRGPLASSSLSARSPPQPAYQQPRYDPPAASASASAPPSSQPLAPSSSSSHPPQNGSASHPSTPPPTATGAASTTSAAPREREEGRGEERRDQRPDDRREARGEEDA
ncbi:hypothetical protein FB451DRAFT_1413534 [Mycena latifolia]|nr:hypothetical protein FB451DRAFT_1413534 [Mycena latifolia]